VARSARFVEVEFAGSRIGIRRGEDIVAPVATHAGGRQRISPVMPHPMDAFFVFRLHVPMATRALVRQRLSGIVRRGPKGFRASMTVNARQAAMGRLPQNRGVHAEVQRFPTSAYRADRLRGVAVQTRLVLETACRHLSLRPGGAARATNGTGDGYRDDCVTTDAFHLAYRP